MYLDSANEQNRNRPCSHAHEIRAEKYRMENMNTCMGLQKGLIKTYLRRDLVYQEKKKLRRYYELNSRSRPK